MKEVRFFYTPDVDSSCELPADEAQHCTRVLRLKEGDEMMLMDGRGKFYRAEITIATNHRCQFRIVESMPQKRQWEPMLHIAMCPTKNMDRTEWFVEKATEIGVDAFSFVLGRNSERKVLKTDRVGKIVVSAVKQSHKAWVPEISELTTFADFVGREFDGDKFIAHCHDDAEIGVPRKVLLRDAVKKGRNVLVMVGPEGDFSADEVRMAVEKGFVPVSLGESRLRTETAALVAVHTMNLLNQ